ncbi:hypothetical protein HPB50_010288 [Hyalomma asiaticum]|uniref:Uncharacterized protein n=1 Tax=Hyalomma asiaticum TaxID=266040 RepID=A0ACB7RZT2_HYAAI|nr:hypothetical protein HPB50_010288 [Hyalomma asiaticum]
MEGDGRSRIPSLLRRSASVRVRGERHPAACCPSADGDSVGSTASLASCGSTSARPASSQQSAPTETAVSCHRRGSCRSVLHCQRPVDTETYLTPTQRKDRELRQLRAALARATTEARMRDERLRELTAQLQSLQTSQASVLLLFFYTAADSSATGSTAEERAAEGVSLGDSGVSSDMLPSHPESVLEEEESTAAQAEAAPELPELAASGDSEDSTESLPEERRHSSETLRRKYLELRPAYESTQERLRHLERELSEARAEIEKQERWHSEMYLKMYRKGQEAAQFERSEEVQPSPSALPSFRGAPSTERQAEYTLRFLKDAVFYFLTDRSDCRGHLSAIQSILGFSEAERAAVAKAWRHRGRL